jgi:hypothetical protein
MREVTSLTIGLNEKSHIGVRVKVKFAPVGSRSTEKDEGNKNNE